jgi:hypothetical protein
MGTLLLEELELEDGLSCSAESLRRTTGARGARLPELAVRPNCSVVTLKHTTEAREARLPELAVRPNCSVAIPKRTTGAREETLLERAELADSRSCSVASLRS